MSEPTNPEPDNLGREGELIDGGAITGPVLVGGTVERLEDIEVRSRRVRETTARAIALTLVWVLAGSALVHYIGVFILVLADKAPAVEELNRFFNAWLPVISGLVASAITYYFTKERS